MVRRMMIWLLVVWVGAMGSGVWGQEGDDELNEEEIDAGMAAMVSLVFKAPPEHREDALDALREMGVHDGLIGLVMVKAASEFWNRGDYGLPQE